LGVIPTDNHQPRHRHQQLHHLLLGARLLRHQPSAVSGSNIKKHKKCKKKVNTCLFK
jgi:hypothetical protein